MSYTLTSGPLKETDPEGYQRTVARLERQRDERADWLEEAEQVLTGFAPDDPSRELGMAKWQEGLRAYERLCQAVPEPPADVQRVRAGGVRVVRIADAGHRVQHERPERVNRLLADFLNEGVAHHARMAAP